MEKFLKEMQVMFDFDLTPWQKEALFHRYLGYVPQYDKAQLPRVTPDDRFVAEDGTIHETIEDLFDYAYREENP